MANWAILSDTSLDTNGENLELSGSISVAFNCTCNWFGTRFTTELKNGIQYHL